jgi:WD40 repeat protein
VETVEQIVNITGYPEPVRSFCFSPCGRFLAAGDWHGTIHVWNVESGQLEMIYPEYGESQMYPYFLPEGELITATVSERKIEIWRVEKRENWMNLNTVGAEARFIFRTVEHNWHSQAPAKSKSGRKVITPNPIPFQPFMGISLRWIR